jgi:hypothetical protein
VRRARHEIRATQRGALAEGVEVLLPTVTPFKEYTAGMLLQNLQAITSPISNYFTGDASEVLRKYQGWANEAARTLSSVFDVNNDVETLITTPRHWYLMSTEAMGRGPAIHAAVQLECQDRLRVLLELQATFKEIDAGWKDMPAATKVIAPDTNVYLHNDEYFDEIIWRSVAGADEVRLLVPVAVLRELDNNKRLGKNITSGSTRSRFGPEPAWRVVSCAS